MTSSRRTPVTVSLLLGLLIAVPLLPGCAGPSYYAQAAAGQISLMRQRQEIEPLLSDPSTDPELARRLRTAQEIIDFGTRTLGLPSSGSYTHVTQTGRSAVTWTVTAAPEFSLELKTWCFLVAGCVPYRGYFDPDDAERFAGKLRRKGYDVFVAPATAYSTLGWFDDPLLDTMFSRGDTALAGVLFHEMAHQALYVKDDTVFNESFASFVEETSVRQWLEGKGKSTEWRAWQLERRKARAVDDRFEQARGELSALYTSDTTDEAMREEKARIINRLCEAARRLPGFPSIGDTNTAEAAPCLINNARVALHASYRGGGCSFQRLFDASGHSMPEFLLRAGQIADLSAEARKQWLDQPCSTVAREGNL
ncbi:MAG: aminopeptidase [Gammaproteobacteria bacterium]|nr:aminopeptidase [Gammaproteobacteria bacterium]